MINIWWMMEETRYYYVYDFYVSMSAENPMQTHQTLHGFVTRHNSALHELTLFDILLRNQHIYWSITFHYLQK